MCMHFRTNWATKQGYLKAYQPSLHSKTAVQRESRNRFSSSCLKTQGYTKHQANEPKDLGTSVTLYSGNSNKLTTVTLLSLHLPTLAV